MQKFNIDDKEYDYENLSEEARSQINMIQITDIEIKRNIAENAILQTARYAYVKALNEIIGNKT